MIRKKPYIVPIPGTRNQQRMRENAGAADIILTDRQVQALDTALDTMNISAVFGGTKVTDAKYPAQNCQAAFEYVPAASDSDNGSMTASQKQTERR